MRLSVLFVCAGRLTAQLGREGLRCIMLPSHAMNLLHSQTPLSLQISLTSNTKGAPHDRMLSDFSPRSKTEGAACDRMLSGFPPTSKTKGAFL